MAKDLGIQKVGVLIDNIKNKKEFEELQQKCKKLNFYIQQLPTPDIRDKNVCDKHPLNTEKITKSCGCSVSPVKGIFNTQGIIKKEYKNVLNEILNKFDRYFQ